MFPHHGEPAVRCRAKWQLPIISVSLLCAGRSPLLKEFTHTQPQTHTLWWTYIFSPLRARSVCVDSPVCPKSRVCFVIIVLTVFPWQFPHDDSQTHKDLVCCIERKKKITLFSRCNTHLCIYLNQVTPGWWHTLFSLTFVLGKLFFTRLSCRQRHHAGPCWNFRRNRNFSKCKK